MKTKQFDNQFSHIYVTRLTQLREAINEVAKKELVGDGEQCSTAVSVVSAHACSCRQTRVWLSRPG